MTAPRVRIPPSPFFVPIAQLDRALGCGPKGRRFEPSWVHYIWRDARVVESGGLESRCTACGTEGSNPSLSERKRQGPLLSIRCFMFGEMTERSKVYAWKAYVL